MSHKSDEQPVESSVSIEWLANRDPLKFLVDDAQTWESIRKPLMRRVVGLLFAAYSGTVLLMALLYNCSFHGGLSFIIGLCGLLVAYRTIQQCWRMRDGLNLTYLHMLLVLDRPNPTAHLANCLQAISFACKRGVKTLPEITESTQRQIIAARELNRAQLRSKLHDSVNSLASLGRTYRRMMDSYVVVIVVYAIVLLLVVKPGKSFDDPISGWGLSFCIAPCVVCLTAPVLMWVVQGTFDPRLKGLRERAGRFGQVIGLTLPFMPLFFFSNFRHTTSHQIRLRAFRRGYLNKHKLTLQDVLDISTHESGSTPSETEQVDAEQVVLHPDQQIGDDQLDLMAQFHEETLFLIQDLAREPEKAAFLTGDLGCYELV